MSLETTIAALVNAANTLTAAVDGKIGEINTRVNQTFTDFSNWKDTVQAIDINGRAEYKQTIDLTGLPTNYFYPVWWTTPGNEAGESSVIISRAYSKDSGVGPWAGITHVAGLNMQVDCCGMAWNGDANYLAVKRLVQTYRKTVRAINFQMVCIARSRTGTKPLYNNLTDGQVSQAPVASGCYLRGGMTYDVTRSFMAPLQFSKLDSEVTIYETTAADGSWEIRYTVRPYIETAPEIGADYGDSRLAYSMDNNIVYAKVAG